MIIHGDSKEILKTYPDNYFSCCVSDPPYGLGKEPDIIGVMKAWVNGEDYTPKGSGFMGKDWDNFVPQPSLWKEVYRVLKPGAYMLIACGTRTQDWMSAAIRFAGFEIRDVITWHYATGYPKSKDVSKAIDKEAGVERGIVKVNKSSQRPNSVKSHQNGQVANLGLKSEGSGVVTAPATPDAKKWQGWGSALKPATELWTLARKPLSEPTIARNVLKWGTGAINIDGCRIGDDGGCRFDGEGEKRETVTAYVNGLNTEFAKPVEGLGRWPANVVFSCDCEGLHVNGCPVGNLDKQAPDASRFFFIAKASKSERNEGMYFADKKTNRKGAINETNELNGNGTPRPEHKGNENFHPTVKPVKLMAYFCKLLNPEGGIILEPFGGSGTTHKSAEENFMKCVSIDREAEYVEIAKHRNPKNLFSDD